MADNSASMFMWDELVASSSVCENGSCLLKYIETGGAHNVTSFSDSCGG